MPIGGMSMPGVRAQLQEGRYKGRHQEITIRSGEEELAISDIINDMAADEVRKFAEDFRKNVVLQLKMLPAHKTTRFMGTNADTPLRDQIIDKMSPVKIINTSTGVQFEITIDHELALALEEGTGMYGPKHMPITAKNHKYMFIPGEEFAKGYLRKKGWSEMQISAAVYGRRSQAARKERAVAVKEYQGMWK